MKIGGFETFYSFLAYWVSFSFRSLPRFALRKVNLSLLSKISKKKFQPSGKRDNLGHSGQVAASWLSTVVTMPRSQVWSLYRPCTLELDWWSLWVPPNSEYSDFVIKLNPVQTLAVQPVRRQLLHSCETAHFQAKLGGKISPSLNIQRQCTCDPPGSVYTFHRRLFPYISITLRFKKVAEISCSSLQRFSRLNVVVTSQTVRPC